MTNGKRGSLMLRLIIAFCLVSVLGIIIVAMIAGMFTQMEYRRLLSDMQYKGLIDDISQYHNDAGTLEGAEQTIEGSVDRLGMHMNEFLVIDPNGKILYSFTHFQLPNVPAEELSRFGFPIAINSRVVGYLIPFHPQNGAIVDVGSNIRRTNTVLRFGVLTAALLALVAGVFVSKQLLNPIRQLNMATKAIAQGDLEQQVLVSRRDEIGELAESFNQMSRSLKKSRDLRRQLTADIAHELRNPLAIIMGSAEAMSEGVLPTTPEAIEVIYDEARHLSKLIDDLRELSLSEAGELPLHFREVDLRALFEKIQKHFSVIMEEAGQRMIADVASNCPSLRADEMRLTQVLTNVIQNSVKHSLPGSAVTLKAVKAPPLLDHEPSVLITIEDQGSGISEEELPYIFDRFYRGKDVDRVQDGTGLGLAISRSLVENHAGKITAHSVHGKGTVVSILLPISKHLN